MNKKSDRADENAVKSENSVLPEDRIVSVPLKHVDFEDREFCFRVSFDLKNLKEDILKNGQQFPVVLRRKNGNNLFQIISGFRRCGSLLEIGAEYVKAVIRDDLTEDERYYLSYIENEKRKNLTGMDKACAIAKLLEKGRPPAEIQHLYGIGERQFYRLKKVADFPAALKEAIADRFIQITHGLVLMEAREAHGVQVDLDEWIDWIVENKASVIQLKAGLQQRYKALPQKYLVKTPKGGFRLSCIKYNPKETDEAAVKMMREEMMEALMILGVSNEISVFDASDEDEISKVSNVIDI
jgi:ParB/RepB/Spo0J family partition protein